jgi:hypothetical protein
MTNNSSRYLSRKTRDQILAALPAEKVRRLLLDWANLPQWQGEFAARAARYHRQNLPDVEPSEIYSLDFEAPANVQPPGDYERIVQHYPEVFAHLSRELAVTVARIVGELLRKAWDAPDLRKREWYLADAESYYHRTALDRFGKPTEQATPLEAVLYYFRRNLEHALHCPNPGCPAPYFIGVKKGQKYCSGVCAAPAQRAAKLRWWHAHPRKKRKKAKK